MIKGTIIPGGANYKRLALDREPVVLPMIVKFVALLYILSILLYNVG